LDNAFTGTEHFEGMGNVWSALFGDNESGTNIIPTVTAQGKLLRIYNSADMDVILAQYSHSALK
jgi:hypothetical protein